MPPALLLAALTLAAPLQETSVAAQAPRSLLEAVPADARLALVVEDLPALWSTAKASAWAEVARAPAFAALWEQVREPLLEDVPDELEQAADLFEGLQSLVLYAAPSEALDEFPWGLAVRLRPGQDHLRVLLIEVLGENSEKVEHQARQITIRQDGDAWTAALAWRDGLVFSGDPQRGAALDRATLLAQRLEQGPSGTSLSTRIAARRQVGDFAIELFADLGAIARAFRPAEEELSAGELAVWDALGLDTLDWLSLQARLGEGVASEGLMRVDIPSAGLLARWAACARPAPLELARLAPANAIEVAVLGFDAAAAWRALRETFAQSMPEQAAQIDAALEAARSAAGIDIEQDLIANLSGEFAEILLPVEPSAAETALEMAAGMAMSSAFFAFSSFPGSLPGSAVVIGLRDTDPVEELLETLIELGEASEAIEDEEVGGRWMTTWIAMPDFPLRPTWAFLDGALVYSLHAEPVRALLRQAAEGAPPSWLEAEGRRTALAENDGAFMSSSADLEGWVQSQVVSPLASLSELAGELVGEEHELNAAVVSLALELPDLVAKHLRGTMGSCAWIEGEALHHRFWTR